jgi:hypothetical protein
MQRTRRATSGQIYDIVATSSRQPQLFSHLLDVLTRTTTITAWRPSLR